MPIGLPYSPLNEDEDEIRLINIFPYASRSAFVQCILETVSLKSVTVEYQNFISASDSTGRKRVIDWTKVQDSGPGRAPNEATSDKQNSVNANHRFTWGDYAALSYVWGNSGETRTIILNGQEVEVQRNLEVALRALSSRAECYGRSKLWVDAICINQQDYQERSRQIGRMKMIYGDARAVIAWLGEEANNSDKAIGLIQALNEASSKNCGEMLEERLREDHEYLGFENWIALHDFMRREYWYRLWIIQEIVLGSCSITLHCGSCSIDWKPFCQAICFLFEHLWTVKNELLEYEVDMQLSESKEIPSAWKTTSLHLVFWDLWPLSRKEEIGGDDQMSFRHLLDLANRKQSQDIRDRVYGLVGIMDPRIARNIMPDYGQPPSKIYAAVSKTFICTYVNLEPIREGNPWGSANSPSWAADWTWEGRTRHSKLTADIRGPFWRRKGVPPAFKLTTPYYASGEKRMNISFSNDGLHLTCQGFVMDEVDGLTAREDGYFSWAPDSICQPKSDRNAYISSSGVTEALYRTLVADRVAGGLKATERHAAILNLPLPLKWLQDTSKS